MILINAASSFIDLTFNDIHILLRFVSFRPSARGKLQQSALSTENLTFHSHSCQFGPNDDFNVLNCVHPIELRSVHVLLTVRSEVAIKTTSSYSVFEDFGTIWFWTTIDLEIGLLLLFGSRANILWLIKLLETLKKLYNFFSTTRDQFSQSSIVCFYFYFIIYYLYLWEKTDSLKNEWVHRKINKKAKVVLNSICDY